MHKPLSAWINGTQSLPERFYTPRYKDIPENDWSVWLSIEEVSQLHEASKMNWISLSESRTKTKSYLAKENDIIDGLDGGWLDSEEREMILKELGNPPLPSLPIYLITCGNRKNENLVYVGKTKNTSRFTGGHSAALKLHAPTYARKKKNIYRATVWLHNKDEYISLDWLEPDNLAHEILDSVESHLIYRLQSELNSAKKKSDCAKWSFYIHIQNITKNDFLNNKFI